MSEGTKDLLSGAGLVDDKPLVIPGPGPEPRDAIHGYDPAASKGASWISRKSPPTSEEIEEISADAALTRQANLRYLSAIFEELKKLTGQMAQEGLRTRGRIGELVDVAKLVHGSGVDLAKAVEAVGDLLFAAKAPAPDNNGGEPSSNAAPPNLPETVNPEPATNLPTISRDLRGLETWSHSLLKPLAVVRPRMRKAADSLVRCMFDAGEHTFELFPMDHRVLWSAAWVMRRLKLKHTNGKVKLLRFVDNWEEAIGLPENAVAKAEHEKNLAWMDASTETAP